MIAPTDYSNQLEIRLYVSGSFQKEFGLKAKNLPQDTEIDLPHHWWSVWRAEIMDVDPTGEFNYVLFTSAKTLFSFAIRGVRLEYDAVIGEFEAAFLGCLKNNGLQLPPTVDTHCVPMKGRPNALIGTMNMFTTRFLDDLFDWERPPVEAQHRLWTIPCKAMDYEQPGEAFLREMHDDPPFGAEIIPPDDVIPFPEADF